VLNAWALRHADSSLVAVYTYVQPVLTTLLAALILEEEIHGVVAVAAILIFTGVSLASRRAVDRPPVTD
jgi:drug/metabolite transporter (DMT)-like permease